jgi:FAD/FMN-containing dehydrogenase
VQAAILAARRYQLLLSVRGGGHDWAGRALRHAGLVIDLTGVRQIVVDAAAQVATVGGGATNGDVIAAAAPHELSAVTGTVRMSKSRVPTVRMLRGSAQPKSTFRL